MQNQISIFGLFAKLKSYRLIYKGLSDLFVISFVGLLGNLLINREYPLTHLFFVGGLLMAIVGGTLVEIIHRRREHRRMIKAIQKLSAQNKF
jgi:uncharacterized membrane protein